MTGSIFSIFNKSVKENADSLYTCFDFFPFLILDHNLNIRFVNLKASNLLGINYSGECLTPISEFNPSESGIESLKNACNSILINASESASITLEINLEHTIKFIRLDISPSTIPSGELNLGLFVVVSDITNYLINLHESNAKVACFDNVMGVIEFNMAGIILDANSAFEQLSGYAKEDLIGKHHSAMMPDNFDKMEYSKFWADLNKGKHFSAVFKRKNRKGESIWLQASYVPVLDKSGSIVKVIKYATDITTEYVRDFEYGATLEAIHKLMLRVDLDPSGNIISFNNLFKELLGYAESDVNGKPFQLLANSSELSNFNLFKNAITSALNGESSSGIFKLVNKKGREIWLRSSFNPVKNFDNEIYKIVCFLSDITFQHIKDIDNSNQIDAINKSFGTIELAMDGTVISANQNFLDIIKYSLPEVVGIKHSRFMPSNYDEEEYAKLWSDLRNGLFRAGVFKRKDKHGKDIWLEAAYNPILNNEGIPIKVVKYALNITAEKEIEISLNRTVDEVMELVEQAGSGDLSHRLDTSNKEGALVSMCSHINNLLDNISELIYMVKESTSNIDSSTSKISHINKNVSEFAVAQQQDISDAYISVSDAAKSVSDNASYATKVATYVDSATGLVADGSKAMGSVTSVITDIFKTSSKIESILSVINDIAFRTNILSLNAAVEAARAGEHGRGFAVVAGEVRSLAQRSAEAAKEIDDLIKESSAKSKEGMKSVNLAEGSMSKILEAVSEISMMISEISKASSVQAANIKHLNDRLVKVADLSKKSVEIVISAADEVGDLESQSTSLIQAVNSYKVA